MNRAAKKRIQTLSVAILVIAAGGLLILALSKAGAGIPCLFHVITGWDCPGCGATRMALALLCGNLKEAFRYQPAMLLSMPFLLFLFARLGIKYVKTGSMRLGTAENVMVWVLLLFFLLFGIIRNLPFYPY